MMIFHNASQTKSFALFVPFVVSMVLVTEAHAVAPNLDNIIPRGGQRGQEVQVRLQGDNLGDAVDLVFHEPGIEMVDITPDPEKPNRARATLRIAPDAPLGTHAIRVRTATGIGNLRLFSVGNLTEVEETEPNNNTEEAQALALDHTANGVITNEDVDYYAVELNEGDRLAVEVEAIRLGLVLFDVKLRLFGPGGHELLAEDDTALVQQDAAFVTTAHETGKHLIAVSESTYGGRGNYHYRLHVGTFPRPLAMTPLGGAPGEEVTVRWLGDSGLSEQTLVVPAVDPGTRKLQPALETKAAPTPMPFRVSNVPRTSEVEPNNGADQATAGQAPGAFDGVIAEPDDTDWFSFEGKKDQVFEIRLWARALGSPLDGVMTLIAPSGGQVATDDDARGMDSFFSATLPEDGLYKLWVTDHLRTGGPTYAYRVEVTPVEAKLSFNAVENDAAKIAIPKGNRAFLLLGVSRENFDGDLELAFNDLPEGVRVEHPPLAKGETRLPVILHAEAEAPVAGALVDVHGKFNELEGHFDQRITMVEGRNRVIFLDHPVDKLAVAVTEPAPFSLSIKETTVPVVQGNRKYLRVVATRAEGFAEEIKLRIPHLPGGFGSGTATIAGDATEADILLEAQGNAPAGTVDVIVQGDSAGWQVCTPVTPIEVTEQWVQFAVENVSVEQGQSAAVKVAVTQNREYEGTFEVQLERLPKGVTAEPQQLSKDVTELTFPLTVAADAPAGKHSSLLLVTTLQVNEEPITHSSGGAELAIFEPLPPELAKAAEPEPAAVEENAEEAPKRRTRFPESQ